MALLPVRRRDRDSLTRLHDDVDDWFRGFFNDVGILPWYRASWPAIDIAESENDFIVKAEVPGCRADEIDISVNGKTLTISGEKKQEEKKEGKGCYHVERSYGSFRRDLHLATEVDPGKIEASCTDGVLTIKLPKNEAAKPVKVKVKGE